MIVQKDTENADRDLTSQVTVLTDTPDASNPMLCQGYVAFGDGAKDLDGTGGDFELTVTVGGQTIEPNPQTITFSTATRTGVWTVPFPVPANKEVIMKVKSPNAADSDVDVTAYLYQVDAVDVVSISGDSTAADNLESACDNYSVTRGLTGTAVPAAAADAAGGIPISDTGGINMDYLLLNRVNPSVGIVRQQSVASYPIQFFMTDEDNPVLGKTGLAPTVTISKNSGAFGAAAGAVAEIGDGWYSLAAHATDRDTLGEILIHAEAVGANDTDLSCTVVSYNPFDAVRLGLTGIPNAAAGANGGLPTIDALLNVRSDLRAVEGSATVDAVSLTVWAARIFQALIRPFTGNAAARTKAFEDNTGANAFTHTYTNDGNNTRSLS